MFKLPSLVHKLSSPLYSACEVEVFMKRDDQIHPVISGNKWRKLKLYFEKFNLGKYDGLLTFGGAFSNHIAATAEAGNLLGVPTIGIIRGDELNADSNDTLRKANEAGMRLIFVSRTEYQMREEKEYHYGLREEYGNVLIVNEGGFGFHGMMGCTSIIAELQEEFDSICVSAGTGTTVAGIAFSKPENSTIMVFPALKGGEFLKEKLNEIFSSGGLAEEEVASLISEIEWECEYHFGGYGKYNQELIDFINAFYEVHKIALDQVYNAKMMFGLQEKIKAGYFKKGSKILVINTGGVQGLKSLKPMLNDDLVKSLV